jgi:hypothetical protein
LRELEARPCELAVLFRLFFRSLSSPFRALATLEFASIQSLHNSMRSLMRARVKLVKMGARKVHLTLLEDELAEAEYGESREGHFDRVLIDAQCTSSGSWGVNPQYKWSIALPELIVESVEQQQKLLKRAARMVCVGGRIIYVTNSILRIENEKQVEIFLKSYASHFRLLPARQIWERLLPDKPWPCAQDTYLKLQPSWHVGGYFAAVFERTSDLPVPDVPVPAKIIIPELNPDDYPQRGVMQDPKSALSSKQ